MKIEDTEICSKCGGRCCKKCGCDYWVNDINDKSLNGLLNVLSNGNISIVAVMNFKKVFGKLRNYPFLYLRVRNTDRDIVDLLSLKKTCSMLKEDGCIYSYEFRPSGGKNLVPSYNKCYPKEDMLTEILKWGSYQKQLKKIVKIYTGKSVEEKLSEDVENLIYDILTKNYDGVSENEIVEIGDLIPYLVECYKEEVEKAKIRYLNIKTKIKKI